MIIPPPLQYTCTLKYRTSKSWPGISPFAHISQISPFAHISQTDEVSHWIMIYFRIPTKTIVWTFQNNLGFFFSHHKKPSDNKQRDLVWKTHQPAKRNENIIFQHASVRTMWLFLQTREWQIIFLCLFWRYTTSDTKTEYPR